MKIGRVSAIFPLALAVVSFVLCMLALFAGHKQGFMEDYAVVRLNTSMIGHTLFDGNNTSKGKDGDKKGGLLGDIQGWWHDAKDDAKDKLHDISSHVADKLAEKLGISEWYSLHVMDSCRGMFSPNTTASNPGLNVTNCTVSSPDSRLNLTAILDHELKVGPVKLNLADLDWPDSIQDAVNLLNNALLGLFIVYVLGAGFIGLSVLTSLVALWKPDLRRVALLNFPIAALGFLSVLIGSIMVTVAANKAVRGVNKVGDKVGISASRGDKFYTITWVATGFMAAVCLYWLVHFCLVRKERRRGAFGEKAGGARR
ncbi:uncharacterized protein UV8b_06811 [Ustilaginoidea virens]|uniref:Uncharacterized protein n=1 Tax=Ustilaginoidea virens TaxID=1159556 RepID=A0A063CCB3_USTVR|nr:uncharacterized protein UV8b_06811 [Ustilaginoidea virens]QUC22570.1 hypothetical protein UV8b_06811 [Ustilaginoidea virens]GAO16759.1 hypothetical protein UVI_02057930 [Ustilaginoidea virens]